MRKVCLLAIFVSLWSGFAWGQGADIKALLGYPQTIVFNAKIITVSDAGFTSNLGTIAQAMAIRDRKILATGTNAEMRALAGPQTQFIDLKGRTVVPGPVLVHNHPMDWAMVMPKITNHVAPPDIMVNRAMFGPPKEQFAKFPQVLEEAVRAAKPGAWIQVLFVWDADQRHDDPDLDFRGKHITKEQLDRLAPNNPVFARSRDAIARQGRDEMMNQKALDALSQSTVPDIGPRFREAAKQAANDGIPNGSVRRNLFGELIFKDRPDLYMEIMRLDFEWEAAKGQTTFASFLYHSPNTLKAYRNLDRRGQLPNRIAWGWGAIPDAVWQRDFQDPFLLADLATREGSGTDYMWYIGTGGFGGEGGIEFGGGCSTLQSRVTYQPGEFRADLLPPGGGCTGGFTRNGPEYNLVKEGGRYLASHQYGDVNMDFILTMIQQASKEGGISPEDIRSKRHVADHMNGWPRPDQIPILKEMGMIAGGSSLYIFGGGAAWMKEFGEQSVDWVVPRGALVKAGVMTGFELDKPIELTDSNIFLTLLWDIQRKGEDGKVYGPNQRVNREIALKMLTIWGANYVLKEKQLGSLERGKFADFLVLDKDYLTVPEDEIGKLRILMTVVGDKVVHLVPSLAKELGRQPAGAAVQLGGVEGTW